MKKYLGIVLVSLLLCTNLYASKESIKKDGFIIPTNKWKDKIKIEEKFEVKSPKDKIIIIYNHGSSVNDVKSKDCFWIRELRNWTQLAGQKINDKENLGISDVVLQLIVPHCQSDFRRTVYVLELLAGHVSDGKEITNSELINIIDKLGSKDIDLGLFQAVDIVFNDRTAKIDELLTCYYADQVFVPSLIHENFMNYIDYNTNNTYSEKLDLCIEFYNYYIDSQQIKSDIFGHWELADYVGVLSTAGANVVLNKAKIKKVLTKTSFEKSSLVSKYNYRYYNLKYINQLSKSLQIDIKNFQTLSLLVAYCVFLDKPKMDYMIQKLYNAGLNSKEFKKIVKLSLLYQKYSKKFTKKLQNEIDNKFKKLE